MTTRPANRLARETSPYLLQHAHNPVDWYPWGSEALERARKEDRPIFLSIGYSACHWCHVMERESFEDEEIAKLMNERFVNVKVDREERPDLDRIYMQAVQMLTGHGGWPMSVWLTPDLEPFFGGTYFPPTPRMGMPSFPDLLVRLSEAWKERRSDAELTARELTETIQRTMTLPKAEGLLSEATLEEAFGRIRRNFDPRHGGFGTRPKFPNPFKLSFLMRLYERSGNPQARTILETTLTKMARGGIYDQLGGGFHRYSVDEEWLVPHFEKMLYDNALLAEVYLEGWQLTGEPLYRQVTGEILDYVLREMTHPEGGFYSTQDADSEGEEGKFFVWTPEQVEAVVGAEEARVLCDYYDVSRSGNFEHGHSILHRPLDDDVVAARHDLRQAEVQELVARCRPRLFEARRKRVAPGRDDKVQVAWNGLMAAAFARAGLALQNPAYAAAARRNCDFLLSQLRRPDGRLRHSWLEGRVAGLGFIDDYAALAWALLHLYQVDLDPVRVEQAHQFADLALERFWDGEDATFYLSDPDQKDLVMRPRELEDGATPSGNNLMLLVLLWLGRLTGDSRYAEVGEAGVRRLAPLSAELPAAFGLLLRALDFQLGPSREVVLAGDQPGPFLARLGERFLPRTLIARTGPDWPTLQGKRPVDGQTAAYVCQKFACKAPVTRPEDMPLD